VSLSGGSVAGGSLCVMSLNVTTTWAGEKQNSVTVDSSAGTGNTSTASLTVLPPPLRDRAYFTAFTANKISYVNLDGSGAGESGDISTVSTQNSYPALLKAPVAAGVPAITGGSAPGSVLSCSSGSWAPDLLASHLYRAPQSFAYQWTLNGADIGGATSSTYTASSSGSYGCPVIARNFVGSAQQTSSQFAVQAPSTPSAPPAKRASPPASRVPPPASGPPPSQSARRSSRTRWGRSGRTTRSQPPSSST
jgi:hypothetical protein